MFYRTFRFTVALVVGCATGCGDGSHSPDVVAVTGTVTLRGIPVPWAQVMLVPADEEQACLRARGITNAQGQFTLQTFVRPGEDLKGAVPGDYHVTVRKTPPNTLTPDQLDEAESPPEFTNELPEVYSHPETSGLTVTVTADGLTDATFNLQ